MDKESQQKDLKAQIKPDRMPHHVAIIMDGNGRWARKRRLDRAFGHKAGMKAVTDIVEASVDIELKVLTTFTLNTTALITHPNDFLYMFRDISRFFFEFKSTISTVIIFIMRNIFAFRTFQFRIFEGF